MCKIFAMTNMEKVELSSKFVNIVKNEVTRLSDKDGFGYAVLGKNGDIGGERTIRISQFSALQNSPGKKVVQKLPIVLKSSNVFGKIDMLNPKMFIAHGRFSTNHKTLENTHPFTNGEVALIHNGVVQDADKYIKNLTTTCDSEILLRYWEMGGMKAIEESVTGYYAFAILDKKGKMHIARDDRAMLYLSYCRTVDSYIIATTPEIIKNVARRMKWKIESPEEMLPNMYAIFEQNNIVHHEKIDPRESEKWEFDSKAEAAFGKFDKSTGTFKETDPELEDAPGYREALEVDDYYSRRFPQSDYSTANDDAPTYTEEEIENLAYIEGYVKSKRGKLS